MICGVLELENTVQIADKTRLSATKSFVTKGEPAITKVEIEPESGVGFINITGESFQDWFLDWLYTGATRTVTVSLRITSFAGDPDAMPDPLLATVSTITKDISIVTATDDKLFSADKDLMAIEPDILKWVPDGRSTWLNVHRAAQEKIMDALNKMGITDALGAALTKDAVIDIDEVRFWSRDLSLALIFKGVQNTKDDVFDEKAKFYFGEAGKASSRAKIRLDLNGDGVQGNLESYNMTARDLVRE